MVIGLLEEKNEETYFLRFLL